MVVRSAALRAPEPSWEARIWMGDSRPGLNDSVRGRGSYLAAHNLAVFHDGLGDAAQARRWRTREAALRGSALASGAPRPAAEERAAPG